MQATQNAEEVDATVLSSDLVDNRDLGDDDDGSDRFTVRVEYRYTHDGQTYTSENFCPGAGSGCKPSSDFRTDMEEFLADYPEGETVTAYVPPGDPSNAYLIDTGPSPAYLGVAAFGVLLIVLGVWRIATGR